MVDTKTQQQSKPAVFYLSEEEHRKYEENRAILNTLPQSLLNRLRAVATVRTALSKMSQFAAVEEAKIVAQLDTSTSNIERATADFIDAVGLPFTLPEEE